MHDSAHQHDVADLRALYRSTLADVFGYLLAHTAGDRALAEDLTAETYLHATRRFRQGRAHEVTIGWLKTVAKRRLIDHWRRQASLDRRARRLHDELQVQAAGERVEERRDEVFAALSCLSEEQRLVLVLKHVDGMTVEEIAAIIERTPKATESLLGRARIRFRDCYREGGEDDG